MNKMNKVLTVLICLLCVSSVFGASWSPKSSTEIQQNLPSGYEPSGTVWLHALNKLGLVSDGGIFTTLNMYGTEVKSWTIGGDIEGITEISPTSTRVYIVTEYPMAIREVEATTGEIIRTWSLTGIVPNPPSTNSALEGIAFIPASDNVYGKDLIVVGMQGTGALHVLELETTAKLLTSVTPISSGDLSDLYYNTEEKLLYILYDSENVMRKVKLDGTITTVLSIPGNDQEGITILPAYPSTETTLFIAEDSGKFMTYTGFPLTFPVVDSDHDGIIDNLDVCPGYDDLLDVDNDKIPDGCDADDDNDGVPDTTDKCQGYNDKADKDNDGIPDACDTIDNTDSDMDGVIDSLDVCPGYDDRADADSDSIPDACDTDDDNDGILDTLDQCPDHDDKADKDNDGIPDACDTIDNTDSDMDGVIDSLDVCPGYDDK
ncbi:MAG: thrombospondin type 3 repeat-containing protein, partial [Candidatus Woesearchaeota archaeon]